MVLPRHSEQTHEFSTSPRLERRPSCLPGRRSGVILDCAYSIPGRLSGRVRVGEAGQKDLYEIKAASRISVGLPSTLMPFAC